MRAAWLLCIALAACASSKPETMAPEIRFKDKLIYPSVDRDKLDCRREPWINKETATDVALAKWAQDVREAGAQCRANLDFLNGQISKWPK